MDGLLHRLAARADAALTERARPLYLVVDEDLRLRAASGDGSYYGFPALVPGAGLAQPLAFLQGADPRAAAEQTLELVETPSGAAADVHIVPLADGWGLAYLDATRERDVRRRHQQAANELALLHERRERLLAELEDARAELERKNAALEEATRLRSLFIGRMSHEFRTPLAAILGYAELLLEELPERSAPRSRVGAIQRGGRYLLNLVDNLLDQARLEHEGLSLRPSVCDLRSMAAELDEMFRPIADQKGLALAWRFGRAVPERLWLDELRLRQVLVNLLGNAFKFTHGGGVGVVLDWQAERLTLVVEDSGPGVPAAARERIFEPFQQAEGSGRPGRGAGLGLAISRALVRRMGGDLRLLPSERGTRLELTVRAPAHAPRVAGDAEPLRGAVVLIADDDEDMLALLRVYLSAAGSRVRLARTGAQASAMVSDAADMPDLVLLDMRLGAERGSDVALSLRRLGFAGPLVVMSALDDEATRRRLERAGVDAFLAKPLRRGELLDALSALLAGQPAA
jgi:signal transduction histidine kinase/ActR/RegA family two-component response regulator